jgi:tetratricopeptide (TPR) repeat protein
VTEDYASDYLRGTAAALRDDFDAAIDAFERALERDPSSLPAQLGLLDALARAGRLGDADRIAEQVLAREPADSGMLTAVARLREQQGRPGDAAALVARADLGHDLPAYTLYLRVLIEEGRFEEVVLEAERGLGWDLARPYALLAKGLSLLHFGDHAGAAEALARVDAKSYDDLLSEWSSGLSASGRVDGLLRLLAAAPESETASALARKLREAI